MHGQRAGGAEYAGGDLGDRAGRVDQRGSLAHDAARRQNDTGQNAGHGAGQHDGEHRAQLARAEAEAALAVGIGHGDERFLCRAHDDRQYHDGQRERARNHAVAPVQLGDEEQHAEQAVDDGGNPLQGLGRDAHDLDELAAAAGVLDQPDGGKDAERRGDEQRKSGHQHGIDERGRQRDILGVILPCEKLGPEVGDAHDEDVADQEHQHGGCQEGGDPHQPPQRGSLGAGGAAVLPAAGHKRMRLGAGHIGRRLCCGDLRHGRCPLSQG